MFKLVSLRESISFSKEKHVTIDAFPAIKDVILSRNSFILVGHNWGDCDSFGSLFALAFLLRGLGKKVLILSNQDIPKSVLFLLDPYGEIEIIKVSDTSDGTDAVIFVDIPHPSEIDSGFNKKHFSQTTAFIEFDHHVGPGNIRLFKNSFVAYDNVSSTAELIFYFLRQYSFEISHKTALSLALGLVSDTNNLNFMTTSRTLNMRDVLRNILHVTFNEIFEEISILDSAEYQLLLHLKKTLIHDGSIGCIVLKEPTIKTFLGNRTLSLQAFSTMVHLLGYQVDGIEVIVYFYELSPNKYKVGFRKYPKYSGSRINDHIDLRILADQFRGGGHIGAAGFTLELKGNETLEDKIAGILTMVKQFISLLPIST